MLSTIQPSISCLTKTWITSSVSQPVVSLERYTLFEGIMQCSKAKVALLYKWNPSLCLIAWRSMWPALVLKWQAVHFPFPDAISKVLLVSQKPILNRIRWRYCSACSSNGGTTPRWVTHPGNFFMSTGGRGHVPSTIHFSTNYSLLPTNYLLNFTPFSKIKHLRAYFLHQKVTSSTRYRTGHFPSTLNLVFSK